MTEQVSPHNHKCQEHAKAPSLCIYGTDQCSGDVGLRRPGGMSDSPSSASFRNSPKEMSISLGKDKQEPKELVVKAGCKDSEKSPAECILDVMLSATREISCFRELLEKHLSKLLADKEKLVLKAVELQFAETLNSNLRYNPMNFVKRLLEIFDCSDGENNAGRAIFSIRAEKTTICKKCKLETRTVMKLDAITVLFFQYFSRDLAEFFNPEQTVDQQSLFIMKNPNDTLQLLLSNLFGPKLYKAACTACKIDTLHMKQTEIKPLGSGLIVTLPKGWTAQNVSERFTLQSSEAACLSFQLRAMVLREESGKWEYSDKIPKDIKQYNSYPLLLFFEKINVEDGKKGKLECSGKTAGLKAAILGLFTIRGFTDFLEQSFFASEEFQTLPICIYLKAVYELYGMKGSLTAQLEKIAELLKVEYQLPHKCIIQLFNELDNSVKMKSCIELTHIDRNIVTKITKKRKNRCGILHNLFSVLVKTRSSSISYFENWTYSRILNISLGSKPADKRHYESLDKYDDLTIVIELESLIQQMKQEDIDIFCLKSWQSHHPQLYYLGSALIIHINEGQENLIRVPRRLDMRDFDISATYVYQLRAICIHNAERMDTFTVQIIDNSEEISEMLNQGCYAYLLFYEQDPNELIDERAKLVDSLPVLEMFPENKRGKRRKREEKIVSENIEKRKKMDFRFGLQNLGNTCFMNAALNGLYSLQSFRHYFTSCAASKQQSLLSALNAFCRIHSKEQIPSEVLSQFKRAIAEFSDGRQHCANSYIFKLLMLLDTLIPFQSGTPYPQNIFGNKLRQYRRGKCEPLHDIFSALVENLFICIECHHTRRNFSYFRTVDVPIPYNAETFCKMTVFSQDNFYPEELATMYTGSEDTELEYRQKFLQRSKELQTSASLPALSRTDLSQCFKYMLRASLMSAQSLMHCDDCDAETRHYKQSFFRQLSTCFVIHFQRFDERTGRKLDTPIDFPMNLNMSEYCVNDPRKYHLCGVVYHFGSLDFGHYTACIKVRGRWYEVNDSSVREVWTKPQIEDAYMLFYEETNVNHCFKND